MIGFESQRQIPGIFRVHLQNKVLAQRCGCSIGLHQARQIADVHLPEHLTIHNTGLQLNGAGIRSKYFIDAYIAAIYLQTPTQDADAIIAADEIQTIRLVVITSLITQDRLLQPMMEGVRKSAGDGYP